VFIAHIPAGYLLTKIMVPNERQDYRRLMVAGLVGSVLPDADLFYHYLLDHGAHEHHLYATHTPILWVGLSAIAALLLVVVRRRELLVYVGVLLANTMLHLVLDSVASGIMWLYPASTAMLSLAPVPALYHPWMLNFLFNWTFAIELVITFAGGAVFLVSRRSKNANA
jgi:LexA-binding, inner membrane-associated putative hydrolase